MGERAAQTPMANAGSATLGGFIAGVASAAIVANNPELVVYQPLINGAVQGVIAGIGNKARTVTASKGGMQPARAMAWILSWLS